MGGKKSKLIYVRKAPEEKKTVVIVGGNVGSIAAKILCDDFNVILIDQKEYYEIVPGNVECMLEPDKFEKFYSIAHKTLHPKATVKIGKAQFIAAENNSSSNIIRINNSEDIQYDFLIIAIGQPYPFWKAGDDFGKEDNHNYKTIEGRKKIYVKRREEIEKANHILIAGGGAVGVEACGEILDQFPNKQITMVSAEKVILPGEVDKVQKGVLKVFNKFKNFKFIKNEKVEIISEADDNSNKKQYQLSNSKTILGDSDSILHIRCYPGTFEGKTFMPEKYCDANGRIVTDTYSQVIGLEGTCFSIGDATNGKGRGRDNMGAFSQIASKEAINVCDNIYRILNNEPIQQLPPQKLINLQTIGSFNLVGTIYKPDGRPRTSFTGGFLSKKVIKKKIAFHQKQNEMKMNITKENTHL